VTEAEAIRLAQAGDAAAFEFLYQLHGRRVYALCLRMVNNPSDAEDLMQEAFLQLFRKIGTFRGESAFSTWLHRMTVNVVLMRLRKKSLPVASLEETTEPDEETGGPRKDIGGPDLRLSGAVDRVNLERSIEKLPPGYRASRRARVRTQRNRRHHGMLGGEFKVAVTQGAYQAPRIAPRRDTRTSAARTPCDENADGTQRLSYNGAKSGYGRRFRTAKLS
jgi:RNA polymerase sigma factor (sigma-70 family)